MKYKILLLLLCSPLFALHASELTIPNTFTSNTPAVAIGDTWSVAVIQLPSNPQQQNCNATNTSGIMPAGGADILQVVCDNNPWNWNQMDWDEGGWN